MLNIIKSIQLVEIITSINKMDFDRSKVLTEDASVAFSLRTEFAEDNEKVTCRLSISIDALGTQDDGPDIFKSALKIDYIFKILDREAFYSLSDDERLNLASNYSYLDFRARLINSLKSTGMVSIEIPYSIDKMKNPN
ncbi:TPA: hypothetical protein ACHV3X_001433 [Klebsiella variicola]